MAQIQFRGKIEIIYNFDDTPAYSRIKIPKLERKHCDMHAFRMHRKYGSYANSDLFPSMLARIKTDTFNGKEYLRLDQVPECVTVDSSGFLAVVSFEV